MKRFIVMPGVIILASLLMMIFASLQLNLAKAVDGVPQIPDQFMPGQALTPGLSCYAKTIEFDETYCHVDQDIDLTLEDGKILRCYVFSYPAGTTIGQLVLDWGRPVGADYDTFGAMTVYWPDRYAFVMTRYDFGPNARVGFVAFVQEEEVNARSFSPWRGFSASGG